MTSRLRAPPDVPPRYFWSGVAICLAFTMGMLGLNMNLLTQIFGLANVTYFYISFLKELYEKYKYAYFPPEIAKNRHLRIVNEPKNAGARRTPT